MEEADSSEILQSFYETTQCHNAGGSNSIATIKKNSYLTRNITY
jgi:hypothetical protein